MQKNNTDDKADSKKDDKTNSENKEQTDSGKKDEVEEFNDEDCEPNSTIFVKNLNFDTDEATLQKVNSKTSTTPIAKSAMVLNALFNLTK